MRSASHVHSRELRRILTLSVVIHRDGGTVKRHRRGRARQCDGRTVHTVAGEVLAGVACSTVCEL